MEYYFIWLIGPFGVLAIARVVCLHKETSSSLNFFYASDCWCVRNLPLNRNKLSFMINYNLPNIRTFDGFGGGDRHWVASQLSLLYNPLFIVLHEDPLSALALCFSSVQSPLGDHQITACVLLFVHTLYTLFEFGSWWYSVNVKVCQLWSSKTS